MKTTPLAREVLEQLRNVAPVQPVYGRDLGWAHRIIQRHRAGAAVHPATLAMAKDALREVQK